MDDTMTTCLQPTSGVLFDGRVITFTGLDGDVWASQLLTIQTTQKLANVIFDFTDTPRYDRIERVEVVMFNCPQWGIASTTINLDGADARGQPFHTFDLTSVSSLTSCESLVRVCLSGPISRSVFRLQFILDGDSDWVHLAEVTFYARGSTCPPNVILTPPPPTTPLPDTILPTTTPPPDITPPTITPPAVQSDEISAKGTSTTSHGTPPSNITTLMGSNQNNITTTIIAAVVPLSIVLIIVIIVVILILCIVCTTKHKHRLRAKEDHTTIHRQTHNHQPPQDRGHINLCEETGQAYYSSIHNIQGEDVPADQVHNCLQQDAGPVRGEAKSSWGVTVDQNKAEMGEYSTQASKEVGVESMEDPLSPLYAQVDEDVKKPKKKSEDVFATNQQEEVSAFALYAQVDEKKKKNRKKKEEDTSPTEPDQLYAQVDKKKKSKKKKEDSPPPELDQLYAQVDKKKRKKEEKEKSPQESRDMYSVVNKPSAPPVPLKSDLLMEELQ